MEQIDGRRALELLIDTVDRYGEGTVYEKVPSLDSAKFVCRYEYEGNPSCLVGKALYRAGTPLDLLAHLDLFSIPADKLDITGYVTTGGALVFHAAQGVQDNGGTWGEALKEARLKYEYLIGREVK